MSTINTPKLVSDTLNISYTKVQSHEEVSEGQVGDEEPGDVHLRPSKHEDDDNGAIAKECQQKHHPHTTPQSPPVKEVLARHEWTCVVFVGSFSQFHTRHISKEKIDIWRLKLSIHTVELTDEVYTVQYIHGSLDKGVHGEEDQYITTMISDPL